MSLIVESASLTVADLLADLGDIDPGRILLRPPAGSATEEDQERVNREGRSLYELVDGTLVEKAMGVLESILAMALGSLLRDFVAARNLGLVVGPDAMMRLAPGLSRAPDVGFIAWARLAGSQASRENLKSVVPDLAVEILSPSNTPREMERKRREYFAAGVRLVWEIDPDTRSARVYTPDRLDEPAEVAADSVLDGGAVLPGFAVAVARLFEDIDRVRP